MSIRTTLFCAALSSTALTSAQEVPLWMRQPAISPDGNSIVFCFRGDLWRVPTAGGEAVLLTTHEAYDSSPVWSRDGRSIAFASDRAGNNDVYIMPSTGGQATRLTFHSAGDTPSDFTADNGAIIFSSSRMDAASNQQFPSGGLSELYQVPVTGGKAIRLLTTPALNARFNSNGSLLVFHDWKGYEDELRKHHRSSVTRDVWSYDTSKGTYTQLTSFDGEDREPVISSDGRTLYYLSEQGAGAVEGTTSFNIHKMAVSGGPASQVSFLKHHPVRHLSISNTGTLCFSHHGELYTMVDGGEPVKVKVRVALDARQLPERTVSVNGEVSEFEVSPNGKELVFIHRGEVFVTSVKEGTTKRITNTPEQERNASFSPDGRTILYATERNGSWDLYTTTIVRKEEPYFFTATVLKEEALLSTAAEEFQPAFSPDGKEVAFLEERTTLRVMNLASKQVRTVQPGDRNYSYSDGDQYYQWSPDSKWLLTNFLHRDQWIGQAGLVSAAGDREVIDLSRSGYGHWGPTWVMDGKAMITYSSRDGMKNHASWGGQTDVYGTFFTQDAFDRFNLSKEDYELLKEAEDKKKEAEGDEKDDKKTKDKTDKDKAVEALKLELDRIEDRRVRLTIHSSDLSGAALSKDGEKLYYLASFEKGYDLWVTELRSKETKVAAKLGADWASGLVMDKEGKNLFFTKDGGITRFDLEKNETAPVGIAGEMTLNEAAERAYLFEHVWRQVRKKFYDPTLHGVDWDFYKQEYLRALPSISNNDDMAKLLSELLGELNASHTGSGYRNSIPNGDATAALGLFYRNEAGPGLIIEEVLKKGPCVKEGSRIKAGLVIEKIDGVALTASEDPSRHLNRKADKPILLSLHDPATKQRWEETVKPITRGEEYELLYERWVDRCRHLVDSLSGGKLGYVHVRGMDDHSYRTVYDDALGKYHDKQGLVVDTRFNGGGWLHDDLATFLSGKTYMRMEPRGQKLGTEPQFKWQRKSVVVMSESNYSDAHLFPVTYRALGIGKLVGMPVPGTGTAVWWEGLQNGMWFGIPQVGMIDNSGAVMENTQCEPDVKVPNEPGAVSRGRDQQLEAAVKVLLED
jgi:tricorn protease